MPNTDTTHKIIISDSRKMKKLKTNSINLIVTSPPYPMISMWDELFGTLNNKITSKLIEDNPELAFELMNKELDKVWDECIRVAKKDGIICINIGDATRKVNGIFRLFKSSERIVSYFIKKGFMTLPSIIWSKPTNSPNKFMGSGMYPLSAYVTLEHEHILIFRKQNRILTREEIKIRRKSAFFQFERNIWCSDIWKIRGASQKTTNGEKRKRNGAFPLEISNRLVNLFSIKGDTILDPFGGTGTTMLSCMSLQRNSIIIEIDENFESTIRKRIKNEYKVLNSLQNKRIQNNINNSLESKKDFKYKRNIDGIPVRTKQEIDLEISIINEISFFDSEINIDKSVIIVSYVQR